jgi:hypothetical protein
MSNEFKFLEKIKEHKIMAAIIVIGLILSVVVLGWMYSPANQQDIKQEDNTVIPSEFIRPAVMDIQDGEMAFVYYNAIEIYNNKTYVSKYAGVSTSGSMGKCVIGKKGGKYTLFIIRTLMDRDSRFTRFDFDAPRSNLLHISEVYILDRLPTQEGPASFDSSPEEWLRSFLYPGA